MSFTDGVHALARDPNTAATTAVNAPVNFANAGSVNLGTAATPAFPGWGIAIAVGALLLAGSGLLGKRPPSSA